MRRALLPLATGEPVGVVALSGPAAPEALEEGLAWLRSRAHLVVCAPNLTSRAAGYLAGDDDERLAGLDAVLDQGIRVLFAARGGYGATRLLARLPWRRMVDASVTFVGFSDVAAVLNAMVAAGGTVQLHGPMVASGLVRRGNGDRLWRMLTGAWEDRPLFRFPSTAVVRAGRATGTAAGGTLSVLCSLLGTPHEPNWDGAIVFLEEVNEPLYRLDRMLTQLVCSGRLRDVKALIGGSLRGCVPAGTRARRWRELLAAAAPEGTPVISGLPFGHGADNRAFPVGATVELDTDAGQVLWRR